MEITLSPETIRKIERFVASGEFDSPNEVVEAAIEHLDDLEDAAVHIQQGLNDEAAGRLHSLADADAHLRRKYSIPAS
jgi:Arc/MetJ-type ribon-helix-helix transcriptional regulator